MATFFVTKILQAPQSESLVCKLSRLARVPLGLSTDLIRKAFIYTGCTWHAVIQGTDADAVRFLHRLGYPCMVRPSYVLGGRAMEIVYSDKDLTRYINNAVEVCALETLSWQPDCNSRFSTDCSCQVEACTAPHLQLGTLKAPSCLHSPHQLPSKLPSCSLSAVWSAVKCNLLL